MVSRWQRSLSEIICAAEQDGEEEEEKEADEEAGSTDAVTGVSDKEGRPALPGSAVWQNESIVGQRLAGMQAFETRSGPGAGLSYGMKVAQDKPLHAPGTCRCRLLPVSGLVATCLALW